MTDYVVAQASVLIVPSLKKFQEKLNADLKRIETQTGPIKIEGRFDSKKAVAEFEATKAWMEKQDVTLVAKVDTRALTEIRHKYEDLAREFKKGLLLDLKVAGLNLLPQLASGLAAANASMVQLAQSATLLPGLLSGVLSSVGALATGLGGVKTAFKEYGDAQKNAAQSGLQARNNAINVQNAYRDLGRAFKDAQRNLEDLNAQLRDAPLDEADAIIRVQEALAEANDKLGKSGLQQQKDALALIKAENALADTRLRNSRLVQDVAEANAKGVAGADRVTEATDRLSKAQDLAATQMTKLSDSLKKLSPNAQAFVVAVTGMQQQWTTFKNATQDKLFAGLDQEITKLTQNDLPLLQKGFGDIATALNGNVKAAFATLQTEANKGFLENIFGNTADAQAKLSASFDPLIDSFLRLSSVGSDLLPRLADGLTDLLGRFDNFIIRAQGDGSLDKWMNNGIDALKDLGNSIINVGSILNSLQEAFTDSGGKGMLTYLESGTEKLSNFLKSAEGQTKLADFFKEARAELEQWKPFLDQLPGLLQNVAEAGSQWADLLLPFLTTSATLLKEYPGLVQTIFAGFMLWKNISPVVKGVKGVIETFGKVTEWVTVNVFGKADGHIGKFVTAAGTAKDKIAGLTGALVGPAGLAIAATAAVTYIGTSLADAHAQAAEAARRQKTDVDNLKSSLDQVTGAAQAATRELIAGNFTDAQNAATGQSYGNLFKDNPELGNKIAGKVFAGDTAGAIALAPRGMTAEQVMADPAWKDREESYKAANISAQDIADAVNGKPEAKAKYDKWYRDNIHIKGLSDEASKTVHDAMPGLNPVPSLMDIQNRLPESSKQGSVIQNEIYAGTSDLATARGALTDKNKVAYGEVTLKPGTAFDGLGVIVQPAPGPDGVVLWTSSAPAQGSALAEQLRSNNITIEEDSPGRFKVTIPKDQMANYVDKKYATGGLISGPGSGTSDSILARLSHGEYVINAQATRDHLPLLEQINGGKLPGFAPGGVVPWIPKSPSPAPMPPPTPGVLTPGALGSISPNPATSTAPAPKSPWDSIWDFITPSNPGETRTATVTTDKSAFNNGFTPKPPAGDGKGNPGLSNYLDSVAPATPAVTPPSPKPAAPAENAPVSPTTNHGAATSPVPGVPVVGPGNLGPGPGNLGPGPGNTVAPSLPVLPVLMPGTAGMPTVGYQPMPYGLKPGTAISYGQAGFPDWVNSLASRFNVQASTYAGHQEGSGLNKGIDFSGTPEQMAALAQYALTAPGVEQVIFEDPTTGKRYGRDPGDRGPNQTIDDYYRDDWAGHRDHVHIRTSQSIPLPEQLMGMVGGSPSNMPLAMTPTGVGIPQLTYADGNGDSGGGLLGGLFGGFKMPTPEEYAKGVSDAWMSSLDNLVKNAGQIAIKFLGSFFGLDFSSLLGTANTALTGFGFGKSGDKKSDATANLPANADVSWIMANKDKLPPGYADQLLQYVQANPGQAQNAIAQVQAALSGMTGAAGASAVQYNPKGGAEQWRPVVRQALAQVATKYGINNLQAWEDDIVGQINLESGGNPNIDNLNDPNGQGGTQQVFGLGQFHPDTFRAHNVKGGDIHDPVAQIYAMIDYLASPKYGVIPNGGVNWKGNGWRNGKGYAAGGKIMGEGSQTSDSILARVSNGEYIVKASAAQKHLGLLNAINAGKLPGFADGMLWPIGAPAPVTPPPPPPVTTPEPAATPVVPDPMGPVQSVEAGVPAGPTPDGAPDPNTPELAQAGAVLGGIGDAAAGIAGGAQAPAGGTPEGDPRSVLPGAPQNLDHNNPAIAKGVEAAAGVIKGAVQMAVQAGSIAANASAPGSGQGVSSAAGIIDGLVSTGTSAVVGAVNILSSLGVGTLTPGSTAGAYGTPLLPDQAGQQPYTGPSVVNNFNGGVHTSNNEEFYKIQQRRELQNASPYLPQR